tara:strand:+ start:285 stop:1367 length:1083 start_codon:yes stop_codon:yes gene_type:complete
MKFLGQFSLAKRDKINKYLRQVDNNKYYSNFGPLYFKLKKKIERNLNYKDNNVILTSSGHSSLLAVTKYLSTKLKKRYVLCPSFSFYSNPLSIIDSGFKPYFVDINANNLVIDLKLVKKILSKNNDIAFLMVVSPFGYPVDIEYLNKFQREINIPIVYDAADTYFNLKKKINNKIFITCSFHPTKTFGSNESGLIICPNKYEKIFENIINFGISKKNNKSNIIGFNGKFSEYDAAILLSNFDNMNEKIKNLKKRVSILRNSLKAKFKIVHYKKKFITNKITFYKDYSIQRKFIKLCQNYNISLIRWWSKNAMHKVNIFQKYPKSKMTNTLKIKKNLIGFYINDKMKITQIKSFCSNVEKL